MDAKGTIDPTASSGWSSAQKWTPADDQLLRDLVPPLVPPDGVLRSSHWKKLAEKFPGRSYPAIQSHWYQITHAGTKHASKKSLPYHSHALNSTASKKSAISVRTVGPQRSRKSSSQLSPKAQKWTPEDDDLLQKLVSETKGLDKKFDWEAMSNHFVGRTAKGTMEHWYKNLRPKGGTSGVLYNFQSPQFFHDDGTGVEKMDIESSPAQSPSRDQLGVLLTGGKSDATSTQDPSPAPASSLAVVVEYHTWSKEELKTLRSLATDRKAPWSEIAQACGGRSAAAVLTKWTKLQKAEQALQAPAPVPTIPPTNATPRSPHTELDSTDVSTLKVTLSNPRHLNKSTIAPPSSPPIPIASSASSDATPPPAGLSIPASAGFSYQTLGGTEGLSNSSLASPQAFSPPTPVPTLQFPAFAGLDNAMAAIRRILERSKAGSEGL
ncbi:hypothetical protein RQP46_006336 [Phenoliferia psychrophenolica]